ncbi:creatininase family protein [Aeromonas sp. MdU4]|uniref:creatininase family protein n=1 Tax=Aeromonas sp. MdU4 TaxID=3342819 RepID=UPI0035B7F113
MVKLIDLVSNEITDEHKKLPVIIPIGLIESHGPHLPLSVDLDTANYFSKRVCEKTGAILAPMINYGFADEMAEYIGTIGVRPETLTNMITDICNHFCSQGFKSIIILSGHGANKSPCEMAFWKIWEIYPELKIVYWNYWAVANMTHIHHADKGETEIAMAVGTPCDMSKAKDFIVEKPWYKLRSRAAIEPTSGGINGRPTDANLAEGEAARDKIIESLCNKVFTIIKENIR